MDSSEKIITGDIIAFLLGIIIVVTFLLLPYNDVGFIFRKICRMIRFLLRTIWNALTNPELEGFILGADGFANCHVGRRNEDSSDTFTDDDDDEEDDE